MEKFAMRSVKRHQPKDVTFVIPLVKSLNILKKIVANQVKKYTLEFGMHNT